MLLGGSYLPQPSILTGQVPHLDAQSMPSNNRLQRTVMDKCQRTKISAPPLNRDVRRLSGASG
jgi:hypothetical protein